MSTTILNDYFTPIQLRALSKEKLLVLAKEIREEIIHQVATKEGHLGASLGVVELTIALHYVFNTPEDLLVWDVGHQAYGHKLITGRKKNFHTNRQLGGISGFPKREESIYDTFGVGHSSTSISAALGMAIASKLQGDLKKQHIAVIGDASIASGMAFEALNHAVETHANLLVIINDNAIGIDPSIGALKQHLAQLQENKTTNNIFTALGFTYSGAIDGHNIPLLLQELEKQKNKTGCRVLHVITTKGKGLKQAEQNQVTYHAPGKFDQNTGDLPNKKNSIHPAKYQDVFGLTLLELAKENTKIVGITPAMPTGSSLKYMMEVFPQRAFDVGIAEQHAVTLAAGIATQGFIVYCTIYSTFLQRGYDQIIHDVALQNLPVIFCIDRAGLVGEDGATHHGVFDIAYLRCIPNIIIYAPKDQEDLRNILYTAQLGLKHPIAIRYPRGKSQGINWQTPFLKLKIGKAKHVQGNGAIAVLSVGSIAKNVTKALEDPLVAKHATHYDMQFIKPLDTTMLDHICKKHKAIITIEDGVITGGFASAIAEYITQNSYNIPVRYLGIKDHFVEHGTIDELEQENKICALSIQHAILEQIKKC